jgi:hypothetical protein
MAKALSAKLDAAAKARAKGDCANAATIYTSFISELLAAEWQEGGRDSCEDHDRRCTVPDSALPVSIRSPGRL